MHPLTDKYTACSIIKYYLGIKKGTIDTLNYMDGSQLYYAQWKKSDSYCMVHL